MLLASCTGSTASWASAHAWTDSSTTPSAPALGIVALHHAQDRHVDEPSQGAGAVSRGWLAALAAPSERGGPHVGGDGLKVVVNDETPGY